MSSSDKLVRGLPSTQGIRDPAVRRWLDAAGENLRALSNGVIQAAEPSAGTRTQTTTGTALSLRNTGGGLPVVVSAAGGVLSARTLAAGDNMTLKVVDGALVFAATPEGAAGTVTNVGDAGEGVAIDFTAGLLRVRKLKAGSNITLTVLEGGELEIAAAGSVTGVAPIAVDGAEISLDVPGLAEEAFDAGTHVLLVHNGSGYAKAQLGNLAEVDAAGVAAWKIPVADGSGGVAWKTITEILVGAVTTAKDPVAGDTPLAKDAGGALYWGGSGACA